MRKIICLLLVLLITFTVAACGKTAPDPSVPETTEGTNPAAPDATVDQNVQTMPEGTPNYFGLSISDEDGNYKSLSAYDDDMGQITVEYQGDYRKVTTMDVSVMDQIAAELAKTGLAAFNGENVYEDGMASASMYVAYPDGSFLGAGYSGTIPQAFLDGYDTMDNWFQSLLADVPEYVPRPMVMGQIDPNVLTEVEAILDASGMEPLDMFTISDVPKDEYFATAMGLSTDEGIVSGTTCNPMMSVTAYSCAIAVLEDESKAADVQKDFAEHIDWFRWVCVSADSALIAQKGNMVLCLVASGDMYRQTADALDSNGWSVLQTLEKD